MNTQDLNNTPPAEQRSTESTAAPKLKGSPFESYVAQVLHAAWVDGWASCRDSEFVGDEAMNEAFNQCVTLNTCMSIEQAPPPKQPIDMVLYCPACGMQHVDTPEHWGGEVKVHRSHLCVPQAGGCGHIWRPADVSTNGVAAVKSKGKADSPISRNAAPVALQAEPVAWEINYTGAFGQPKKVIHSHNAVGDYRMMDSGATSRPLYTHPAPSLAELRAKVERLGALHQALSYDRDMLAQQYRDHIYELRAKVEALPGYYTDTPAVWRCEVLAEIDKMGGGV